jgi:short subunit dehydrogenase-like uncharacterized protein
MQREFDLVVYGASGFTGRQAADYLVRHAPDGVRWAIAGRDAKKLEKLGIPRPVIVADGKDDERLGALAARACVVLNMAGPFSVHGDGLVDACIAQGTDYIDISGDVARIQRLIESRHPRARDADVRVVNFCGVSSLPVDVGAWLLNERLGGRLVAAKAAVEIAGGALNGGTVASIIEAHESGDAAAERDPLLLGPVGRLAWPLERDPSSIGYDVDFAAWMTQSPMGIPDTRAVRRSASLSGRDVVFQEYLAFGGRFGLLRALGMRVLLGALNLAFRFPLTRGLLGRLATPGSGPSEQQMNGGSLTVTLQGRDADGSTARVRIRADGDPGNRVTVICACESALALVLDRDALPPSRGVLTPSVAFGARIVERLRGAGVRIE